MSDGQTPEMPEELKQLQDVFGSVIGQFEASMNRSLADVDSMRWEYRLVPWPEVNELARDGWQMYPIPPAHLSSDEWRALGYKGADLAARAWMMCRKLGVADSFMDMLKAQIPAATAAALKTLESGQAHAPGCDGHHDGGACE